MLYTIKVVGGNKTYGNFGKTWHKQVKELTNNEEDIVRKEGTQRRRLSSNSTDIEDTGFTIAPIISNSILLQSEEITYPCNYMGISALSSTTSISEQQIPSIGKTFVEQQNLMSPSEIVSSHSKHSVLQSASGETQHDILKNILNELVTNRLMKERILNQLSSLRDEASRLTSQMVPGSGFSNVIDQQYLNKFPFSTQESIIEFEDVLQSDNDSQEKFKNMLCSVGGVDAKTHIRRILSKLYTNKFAVECSWTGRAFEKNVVKFKIQNLNMIAIMKSV